MFRARVLALAATAAGCLAFAGAAQASPGASGVGDPYFPGEGNGGYDALHYDLKLSYTPRTDRLAGTALIQARALVPLSRFNLDLEGLRVRRVTVDGKRAAFRRAGSELRITPAT